MLEVNAVTSLETTRGRIALNHEALLRSGDQGPRNARFVDLHTSYIYIQ